MILHHEHGVGVSVLDLACFSCLSWKISYSCTDATNDTNFNISTTPIYCPFYLSFGDKRTLFNGIVYSP